MSERNFSSLVKKTEIWKQSLQNRTVYDFLI
jgi:hypothetical protein